MASEIRVDTSKNASGLCTVTYSNTGAVLSGITTGTFSGDITGAVTATTGTFSGDISIADKIIHTGDTNTAIRFPSNDTFAVETGGSERVRIDSSGSLLFNQTQNKILVNTSDGSDSSWLNINGGGDASQNRGAGMAFYGNENSGNEGKLWLLAGNSGSSNGEIIMRTGGVDRLSITSAGIINLTHEFRVGSGVTIGSVGVTTFSGTSDVHLVDNVQLNFGNGKQGDIYRDSSQMIINNDGGNLKLRSTSVHIAGLSNEKHIVSNTGVGVTVFYNASPKLETTSTGVKIASNAANTSKLIVGTTASRGLEITTVSDGSNNDAQVVFNAADTTSSGYHANLVFQLAGVEKARLHGNGDYFQLSNTCTGITFNGDYADGNRLDDYEQGTFTPVLSYTSGASGVAANAQQGRYTKIGDTCFFQLRVNLTDKGTSSGGNVQFSGLPFTPSTHTITNSMVNFDAVQGVNASDDGLMPFCQVQNGNLVAYWHDYGGSGGYQELNHGNLSDNAQIAVSGEFRVGNP